MPRLGQAGLKADEADSGAVILIQRFGSAANLNIHLHCLVLDGVYRRGIDANSRGQVLPFAPCPSCAAISLLTLETDSPNSRASWAIVNPPLVADPGRRGRSARADLRAR